MDAREQTATQIQCQTGAILIPPYNYGPTISGQGTMALEFLEQVGSTPRHLTYITIKCSTTYLTSLSLKVFADLDRYQTWMQL